MYCKYCGEKLKDGSKFCGKCGKEQFTQTVDREKNESKKEPDIVKVHEKKKKKVHYKGMKIGLAILLIVLVGFMVTKGTYKYLAPVEDENGKWGYINERGVETIECKYDIAYPFMESGVTVVGNNVGKDAEGIIQYKYGLIDKRGNEITELQYDLAMPSTNKLIAVAKKVGEDSRGFDEYNWGFVNEEGKQIVNYIYQYETYTSIYNTMQDRDFAIVSVKTKEKDSFGHYKYNYGVIDSTGKEVIPVSDQRIGKNEYEKVGNENLLVVERNGKYGVLNFENEIVVPFEYDDAKKFSDEGLAAVKKNGMWGYIDEEGKVKIPFQYQEADSFGERGWAFVKEYDKSKFISVDGEEQLTGDWTGCDSSFDKWGIATVECEQNDGSTERVVINESGREIFPKEYDMYYFNRIAWHWDEYDNSDYFLLGRNGKVILENYRYMSSFGDNDWTALHWGSTSSEDGDRTIYTVEYVDGDGNSKLKLDKQYAYAGSFGRIK